MDSVLIVGPPAVGKATVARELARLTGYRLLLNTLTAEMLGSVFKRNESPFRKLHVEFQDRLLEEAAAAGISVVSTVAWDFDEPFHWAIARRRFESVRRHGGRTCVAALSAPADVRVVRNLLPDRLAAKPVQASTLTEAVLREMDKLRTIPEPGELDEVGGFVVIDTTAVTPQEAANQIVSAFGLPTLSE